MTGYSNYPQNLELKYIKINDLQKHSEAPEVSLHCYPQNLEPLKVNYPQNLELKHI